MKVGVLVTITSYSMVKSGQVPVGYHVLPGNIQYFSLGVLVISREIKQKILKTFHGSLQVQGFQKKLYLYTPYTLKLYNIHFCEKG